MSLEVSELDLNVIWDKQVTDARMSRKQLFVQLFGESMRSMRAAPMTTILAVLTIACTLLIFCVFISAIENLQTFVGERQVDQRIYVYLKDGIDESSLQAVRSYMESMPLVEELEFVSEENALANLKESLGEQAVILEGLEERNPLPSSFEIKLTTSAVREGLPQQAIDQLYEINGVEYVHYSGELFNRFGRIIQFLKIVGSLAVLLALILTAFVIANTIRLAVYAHRSEIDIMRLVGATLKFVRMPFLIEGGLQGLLGALLSLLIFLPAFLIIKGFVDGSFLAAELGLSLKFLSPFSILIVAASGTAVGLLGSYLSVNKFIRT